MTLEQAQQDLYLKREARKRGVSVELLVSLLLSTIANDQMVLAVLDDGDAVSGRLYGKLKATG